MSWSDDDGEGTGLQTARGRDWPTVRQFNVFLKNRLGALLDVVRRFESTDVRIVSLTVVETADCAIIRLVLSEPERAAEIFRQAKLYFTESDLLVVQLPDDRQPPLPRRRVHRTLPCPGARRGRPPALRPAPPATTPGLLPPLG